MDKKMIQKSNRHFTETEKHQTIQELISTQSTKVEIWVKYTCEEDDYDQLLRWIKAFVYHIGIRTRWPNIVSNFNQMSKIKREKLVNHPQKDDVDFANLQLEKRIVELEKQLKEAELKAIAFSTMVDIAEDMFKTPIRKKINTKPYKPRKAILHT